MKSNLFIFLIVLINELKTTSVATHQYQFPRVLHVCSETGPLLLTVNDLFRIINNSDKIL